MCSYKQKIQNTLARGQSLKNNSEGGEGSANTPTKTNQFKAVSKEKKQRFKIQRNVQ